MRWWPLRRTGPTSRLLLSAEVVHRGHWPRPMPCRDADVPQCFCRHVPAFKHSHLEDGQDTLARRLAQPPDGAKLAADSSATKAVRGQIIRLAGLPDARVCLVSPITTIGHASLVRAANGIGSGPLGLDHVHHRPWCTRWAASWTDTDRSFTRVRTGRLSRNWVSNRRRGVAGRAVPHGAEFKKAAPAGGAASSTHSPSAHRKVPRRPATIGAPKPDRCLHRGTR
jgi:hypothetical protein